MNYINETGHAIHSISPTLSPAPDCAAAREVLELTDDIIYEVDPLGIQTYLNSAGHSALALDMGAGLGKPWKVFIHEDDLPAFEAALDTAIRIGNDVTDLEMRLISTLGAATRTVHRLRPLRGADGSIRGVVCVGRDVTNLRRVEEQLHQSQKLETIGMLAGGIAHDFNNMLAAILGYTELMLEEKDSADPEYRGLHYIQTSTERAAALVRQILVYTRKSGSELKPVKLGEILRETLHILQSTLPKTIRVAVQADEGDDHVLADAGRIQQALMNLCVNARDAMPNGGELRMEIEHTAVQPQPAAAPGAMRPGNYVRVRIQDTGNGMPPHVLEQIWAPFFTTKPAGSGTGLGLAVVQQIILAHHGYISAESQVGRGASFFVYLPVSTSAEMEVAGRIREPVGGTETLLIVDDEPMLLDLLRDILEPKGYHVLVAATPRDALEYIEAVGDKIDLVISDNMMPAMTGKELAREIRNRYPGMRILVCSGFSPTSESDLGQIDYVSSYVQKPYQRRDLLARVRETLDGKLETGEAAI